MSSEAYRPHAPVSRPAGEGEREAVARLICYWSEPSTCHDAYGSATCRAVKPDAWVWKAADAILSLLRPAAPDAGGGWMPIETAPKDGTWIIVSDGSSVEPAVWSDEEDDNGRSGWCAAGHSYGGVLYDLHYVLDLVPTHWMPLPAPPALQQEGE